MTDLEKNSMLPWEHFYYLASQWVAPDLFDKTFNHSIDRRFNHPAWDNNLYFKYIKHNYLLWSAQQLNWVKALPIADNKQRQQLQFVIKQMIDAYSPTNFVFSNPEVLDLTIKEKGENLTRGWNNYVKDLKESNGAFEIPMTDMKAFNYGENIACTKGQVVFKNELIELIQYQSATTKVFGPPLLVFPPWINKYYILDLQEKNSYIKWIVEQGFTVFIVSWLNPDKTNASIKFEDYLRLGALPALDAVLEITGQPKANVLGFCLGGTLVSCLLGYLAKNKDERILSATFLATLIDFSDPGEIGLFLSANQVQVIEKNIEKNGYLDGKTLSATFRMLRSNELIWNYYIDFYLKGKDPYPFDLLFWNSDYTNLPAKMHSFYLRQCYVENKLVKKNGINLLDTPIDLSIVDVPSYFISTEQDHIAPWKTTFLGAQWLGGNKTFVLGGSGHISGIINPPVNNKYYYRVESNSDKKYLSEYSSPQAWYDATKEIKGSWWAHWIDWLKNVSGEQNYPAQPYMKKNYKPLYAAPGKYVFKKASGEENAHINRR